MGLCVWVGLYVSVCECVGVYLPVCLGKPVHHVVPKCQPMTRSSLTYHKMRKIGAICDFFKLDEVSCEAQSWLRDAAGFSLG